MVSVIMPVYNSEKYVGSAIESVLAQTCEDFELICVDDGSQDRSGDICDFYAEKDSRVRVFHGENKGICGARNQGLDAARGEFITFIDNDDQYDPDLLKENLELIQTHKADIVRFGYHISRVSVDGSVNENEYVGRKLEIWTEESIPQKYRQMCEERTLAAVWDKMFRSSFLKDNGFRFDENLKYGNEDIDLNYRMLPHVTRMVSNPKVYYRYYGREGISTSVQFRESSVMGLAAAARQERRLFDQLNLDALFPGFWYHQLTRTVANILRHFSFQTCRLSVYEKAELLARVSLQEPFSIAPDRSMWKQFRREHRALALVGTLFYHRCFLLLSMLTGLLPIYMKLRMGRRF